MSTFVLVLLATTPLVACPFCPAVKPTFAEQRETSDWAALVEVIGKNKDEGGKETTTVRVRQLIVGNAPDVNETLDIDASPAHAVGTLLMALREPSDERPIWHTRSVNETSYAYFYRTPSLRKPTAERLQYFARYLEDRDRQIATDAFAEFARIDYDTVASVADLFDMSRVRSWLVDAEVPARRKGFYGLVLGLASDDADRVANAKLLRERITADESDFRAGFDGLLAGYLLLEGENALDLIDKRFLKSGYADERPGDTRHAMTALRFYHQYGKDIPVERLRESLRLLLDRPDFAAAAIVDLARWQDWSARAQVVACWDTSDTATSRAVVGYLIADPQPDAQAQLKRLRREFPDRVAAAERFLELFGGGLPATRAQ